MHVNHRLTILFFCAAGAVSTGFAFYRIREEAVLLGDDIQHQAALIAESQRSFVESSVDEGSWAELQTLVDGYRGREPFAGMAIYNRAGRLLASTSGLVLDLTDAPPGVNTALQTGHSGEAYLRSSGKRIHVFAVPLSRDGSALGVLSVFHDVTFIAEPVWRRTLARLWLFLLIGTLALLIGNWTLGRPRLQMAGWYRGLRSGRPLAFLKLARWWRPSPEPRR